MLELQTIPSDVPSDTPSSLESNPKVSELNIEHLPSQVNKFTLNLEALAQDEEDEKPEAKLDTARLLDSQFSVTQQRVGKTIIFLAFIGLLIGGRFIIPSFANKMCAQDKVLDVLAGANTFINAPGKEHYRDFFQFLCSALVDLTFISTFGYWVTFSKTSRLPISLGLFYLTRAFIQSIWYSPFPEGSYWDSPGVPSLVVPYGRGSDFFFSGHSGFMLVCALEWHRIKVPFMRNLVLLAGTYTVMILLVYRIHYSIDCFVGLFFADWCFWTIDTHRHHVDIWWVKTVGRVRRIIERIGFGDDKVLIDQNL